VVILGIGFAYLYYLWEVQALTREAAGVEAELQERQSRLAQLSERGRNVKRNRQLEETLAKAEARVQGRELVSQAIRDGLIGASAGFSDELSALARQTISGVWLTTIEMADGGKSISLRGRALNSNDVPALVRRYSTEPALQGRSFVALDMETAPTPEVETAAMSGASVRSVQVGIKAPEIVEFHLAATQVEPEAGAGAEGKRGEKAQ
jgi:hypothetical protein